MGQPNKSEIYSGKSVEDIMKESNYKLDVEISDIVIPEWDKDYELIDFKNIKADRYRILAEYYKSEKQNRQPDDMFDMLADLYNKGLNLIAGNSNDENFCLIVKLEVNAVLNDLTKIVYEIAERRGILFDLHENDSLSIKFREEMSGHPELRALSLKRVLIMKETDLISFHVEYRIDFGEGAKSWLIDFNKLEYIGKLLKKINKMFGHTLIYHQLQD